MARARVWARTTVHHRTKGIGRPSPLTVCGHRSRGTRALRAVKGVVATVPGKAHHERLQHHHARRTIGIGRPSSLTACGLRSRGTRALRAVIGVVATVARQRLVTSIISTTKQAASPRCQGKGSSRASSAPPCTPRQRYWETQPPHCARPTLTKDTGLQSGHRSLRLLRFRRAAPDVEERTAADSAASNCSPSSAVSTEPSRFAASVAMPPPAAFGRDFGQEIAEPLRSCSNRSQRKLRQRWRSSAALAAHANIGRVPVASIAPRQRTSKITARTAKVNRSPAAIAVVEALSAAGGDLGSVVLSSAARSCASVWLSPSSQSLSGRGRFRHWLSSAASPCASIWPSRPGGGRLSPSSQSGAALTQAGLRFGPGDGR